MDRDASGKSVQGWLPGVGELRGTMQALIVGLKAPAGQPQAMRGEFQLTAWQPVRAPRMPTLDAFRHETYMRMLQKHGWVVAPAQRVTLNGSPAFRVILHYRGVTNVSYVVYRPRVVYDLNLEAPTKRWPSVAGDLNAVAQTFTVLK